VRHAGKREDAGKQAEDPGMTDVVEEPVVISGRVKFGAAVFVLSILLPVAGLPLVPSLGLSAAATATVSGLLLVSAEVLGVVAVAIMGKPGYRLIKGRVFGFLKKHGPAERVSPMRYRIGLVMFALPILFGWVQPYVTKLAGDWQTPLALAVVGDLMLLASLFVLGGEFWDKVRSLFIREATASFPASPPAGH